MSSNLYADAIYGFGLHNGELLGMHSWYFGYVLAFVLVLAVFFCAHMAGKWFRHLILWLPSLAMLLLNGWVERAVYLCRYGARCVEYSYELIRKYPLGVSGVCDDMEHYVQHFLLNACFERWQSHELYYLAATLILSAAAFFLSLKLRSVRRVKTAGCCFGLAAALLVLCLLDRHLALSARLLFQPEENSEYMRIKTEEYLETDTAEGYTRYSYLIDWREGYFLGDCVLDIKMGREIPAYTKPGLFAEKAGTVDPDTVELQRSIDTTDKAGWYVGSYMWKVWDENIKSVWSRGPTAFVRIEPLIRSAGSFEENGVLGVLARPMLTATDLGLYTLGVEVPPNIMHVFVPFEIYLLAPLTSLFGIVWLALMLGRAMHARRLGA